MLTGQTRGVRTGFEVELLAPAGSSRLELARELAARAGGSVRRVFHRDQEPSLVPGMASFHTLTPAFEVRGGDGALVCTLVNDVTLMADLDRAAPPRSGWWRAMSDDVRLIHLLAEQVDPGADLDEALVPVAALFATSVLSAGAVRSVQDRSGATVAMAAPLPPQRERPCEVVTPPLVGDHTSALEELLAPARELGFTVPAEAAVHLHLDAAPFATAHAIVNVVRLFSWWAPALRAAVGTNERCRRLGPLPQALVAAAAHPVPGEDLESPAALERLRALAQEAGVTKYADVNLANLLGASPVRPTLEVRLLPGLDRGEEIVRRSTLVGALLARCCDGPLLPPPNDQGRHASLSDLVALAEGGR